MLSRSDQPNINNFNFSNTSVFYANTKLFNFLPPLESDFLLLDGTNFFLLDGTDFLLLGN